jgi:site-specific recombinase XerD
MLLEFASAAVRGGADPSSLQSSANLLQIEVVKTAFGFLLARHKNVLTKQIGKIASEVSALARCWVKVDSGHYKQIEAIRHRLTLKNNGMAPSTRMRLQQFATEAAVRSVLGVPQKVLLDVRRKRLGSFEAALKVQTAVAIEILVVAPMRASDLANLRLNQHLVAAPGGKIRLKLAPGGRTNKKRPGLVFGDTTSSLIKHYCKKHRPRLCRDQTTALFPGRGSKPKSVQLISMQVSSCILAMTGLTMTLQLFRHFAAEHFLAANPDDFATMRYVLGHDSLDFTQKYYANLGTASIYRDMDKSLFKVSGGPRGHQSWK